MNIKPSTIFTGDNLPILRGINSECIDLVYLDPPFNSNRNYQAPIGSKAAGAAFKDTWTLSDLDQVELGIIAENNEALYTSIRAAGLAHGESMQSYLTMMASRLIEIHRVLKSTGSVYLHCDPTASHYLKMLMDCIFGKKNFRNEIAWCYSGGGVSKKSFARKHDTILFYAKSNAQHFNPQYRPYGTHSKSGGRATTLGGTRKKEYRKEGAAMTDWWTECKPLINWSKEKCGYPTQKPLALLHRIIQASSNEGDVVLDPFCGCATACISAEINHRNWIGIDISATAYALILRRMQTDLDLPTFKPQAIINRLDNPQRTDIGGTPKAHKYNHQRNKQELYGIQEGYCTGCAEHFFYRNLTVDHIIPQSKGGSDYLENLQLLCAACNSMKGTGTQAELRLKLKQQRGEIKPTP